MKKESEAEAFQRVQTARHAERPYSMDLFSTMFEDFVEIHGDRRYADDAALVCGFARLDGFEVAVVGQQKGRDTNQRRMRNFGMPKPEGYRKALRLMKMAEKFRRPIITFIDTPGAYPGIDAEERGQAEAIAFNLREMAGLKVPIVVVVLGEGGSGGALAIGVGDVILMMENSIYSVISPEGCAAILWKDAAQAGRAAENLRLTAADLHQFGLIDEIIAESAVWTYNESAPENAESVEKLETNYHKITANLKKALIRNLEVLVKTVDEQRLKNRYVKFRLMGRWLN
jgi:acetyl-CoA carboxylase carboxyl transferase subunit alpha